MYALEHTKQGYELKSATQKPDTKLVVWTRFDKTLDRKNRENWYHPQLA